MLLRRFWLGSWDRINRGLPLLLWNAFKTEPPNFYF